MPGNVVDHILIGFDISDQIIDPENDEQDGSDIALVVDGGIDDHDQKQDVNLP